MSTKVETKEFQLDWLKWLFVMALVAAGVYGNAYFSDQLALLYRVLILVTMGLVAGFVAVQTAQGDAFWQLMKAAQVEIRKVVWPTRQEVTQTTLIVVVVVIVMAILLWGLDALLGWLASLIIG